MIVNEMIEIYVSIIKKNIHYSDDMLSKIMLKHNMKPCLSMAISLGNYLDYLTSIEDDDNEYFLDRMCSEYGYTTEYINKTALGLNEIF